MTTETFTYKGETTNGCACLDFDERIADWVPSERCNGFCWDDQCEDFANCIAEFMDNNPSCEYRIEGFPVWYGEVGGVFEARTAMEFLNAITPSSEWVLRWEVTPTAFTAVLSHHDAPTGGRLTVTFAECDD